MKPVGEIYVALAAFAVCKRLRHFGASDATLRPWQLRPVEAELVTSLTHHPSVENLVRASERDLRLAAFSMHRDDDLTFAPLFMLVSVKRQPRSVNHFRNVALSIAWLPRINT